MDAKNNFGRLRAILLIALAICLGLYYLPDEVGGFRIKKVDFLSDLRVKPDALSLDSLRKQLDEVDSLQVDSAAIRDSLMMAKGIDSTGLAMRDSLYALLASDSKANSAGTCIEDFSPGHTGLKRFYAALNKINTLNRPVRVAFLGDSFIEGDIVVADFRSQLQSRFGGEGIGFVPVTSEVAKFRPTIEQKANGWKTWSKLTDHSHAYTLPCLLFEPVEEGATVSFKTVKRYSGLAKASQLKFIYTKNQATVMSLVVNGGADTIRETLPPAETVMQYQMNGSFTSGSFTFTHTEGFQAMGFVLEDNRGVVVDNFSLRGNSGAILGSLDVKASHDFAKVRPYDLIILQYGLNVVNEETLSYNWYRQKMLKVIQHVQECFPNADILLLGVSDRSWQADGEFKTMPAVLSLLHAQRQLAKQSGVPFWNVFGAMGGENSMVHYVNNNWASKDYTHLSFRGGREIANKLVKAILHEKEIIDEMEKTTD